jgi:hypothetical protein
MPQTLEQDITESFGVVRGLLAKRKRLLKELTEVDYFRWYGERIRKQMPSVEFDIMWELFIPKPE